MPIITTPGQQVSPVLPPDPIVSPPTRLQSAFTPSPVRPITPPVPVTPPPAPVIDTDDEFDLDNDSDDATDNDFGAPTPPLTAPKQGQSLSRMSEEERRRVISAVFMLVLGRNPADRDFSYYRFSTLTEDGLTKSLLNLPEHKKLMEKAHEHTTLKQSVSDLDLQVKQFTASTDSMKQELITMQELLIEKNRYIQQMRGIPEDQLQKPSAQPNMTQTPVVTPSVHVPPIMQSAPSASVLSVETRKLPGPFDELKNMIKGIFSGKR